MMQMCGLRGVQGVGVLWLAQRNDSVHTGFGEGEKGWSVSAREKIQQLSHFRQPAGDWLVPKHSLLHAFILPPCHSLPQM